jgi:hypothetical protein
LSRETASRQLIEGIRIIATSIAAAVSAEPHPSFRWRTAARIDGGEGSLIQINGFGLDYDVNVAGQTRIRE